MTVTSKMTEDSQNSQSLDKRPRKDYYHIAQRLNFSPSGKLDPKTEEYKKNFGAMETRITKATPMQKSVPIPFNSNMNLPETSRIETMTPDKVYSKYNI